MPAMISSFLLIILNCQNSVLCIAIRFISDIINIVDAAPVSIERSLKIILTANLYAFLIISDIRYMEIRTPIPLSSSEMAGALNISYILKSFVPSCIDCWKPESDISKQITIAAVVRLHITTICPRASSRTISLKLTLSYIITACGWCFRVYRYFLETKLAFYIRSY